MFDKCVYEEQMKYLGSQFDKTTAKAERWKWIHDKLGFLGCIRKKADAEYQQAMVHASAYLDVRDDVERSLEFKKLIEEATIVG